MNGEKVILAIQGKADTGKTRTLRKLMEIFGETYSVEVIYPTPPQVVREGDFRWIIKIGDLKVAIESCGDPNTNLRGRLVELVDIWKVDIIFCAARTSGATVEAVEVLKDSHGFYTIFSSPYRVHPDQQDAANEVNARHIMDLMRKLKYLP